MKFFTSLFSSKKTSKNTSIIEVKHMDEEISIFHKKKILTPNVDYTILDKKGAISIVKIVVPVCKEDLEVVKCFTRWHDKKLVVQHWGFKKFRSL